MEQYDLLVIGFGKAGKTLAGKLSAAGKKVARYLPIAVEIYLLKLVHIL